MEKKDESAKSANVAVKNQTNIADDVLARVTQLEQVGGIVLPKGYIASNALKGAFMVLSEMVDKDNKPVLESCSRESIAQALFKMTTLGLSVVKKQCAFIAYNGRLNMQMQYFGNVALAKRYGRVVEVNGVCVYEGDEFDYGVNINTGRKYLVKHKPDYKNVDQNKIIGAYAIAVLDDGTSNFEFMSMPQIRKAWSMNRALQNGESPAHKNFPDTMVVKTVINRLCKMYIASSDDSGILDEEEELEITPSTDVTDRPEIKSISMPLEEVQTSPDLAKKEIPIVEKVQPSPTQQPSGTGKAPENTSNGGTDEKDDKLLF